MWRWICAAAWLASSASAMEVPADLAAAVRAYDEAQLHSDGPALTRLLADDYTLVNSRGQVETKAQFIAESTAPSFHLNPFVIREPLTHVWPDGAVMGGITTLSGRDGEETFSVEIRFADIWARRQGRWQVIHTAVTPVKR